MIADIRDDLAGFGVDFDRWYSEATLATSGAITRALERLQAQQQIYIKDGAQWFAATQFGDEKDRVVVRGKTALQPTLPRTLPIIWKSASAVLRSCSMYWAPIITAMWRACARAFWPWANPARAWRSR